MAEHHSKAAYFEKVSSVKRWLIWLTILLVVSAVVTLAFFSSQTNPENSGLINNAMYLVIGSLGLGLILRSFFDARQIQQQTDLASSQIRLLEEVDNFEDFLERSRSSIFRSHIENLYIISQSHGEISQDNLIELLHSRLMARNRIVELFSSILITLGLIGTILGLIIMMESLTAVMLNTAIDENFMKVLVGPGGPLSGLGVAFVTTLIGAIMGGVVLRVLTNVVGSNIMEYTAHIAELTEVYVLPHLRSIAQNGNEKIASAENNAE